VDGPVDRTKRASRDRPTADGVPILARVNEPLAAAVLIGLGYLLGSVPMGVIVARLSGGTDPRTVGSGRTGGTNVLRAMGPGRAILVASLDVAKGAVAILIARAVGADESVQALAGLAAVIGAWRSLFLRFGGGRGVGTGVGGMLVVSPAIVLLSVPVFVVLIGATGYVSLGSLLGTAFGGLLAIVFVIAGWLDRDWLLYILPGLAIVWLAHADNIRRLREGNERRVDWRRLIGRGDGDGSAER
jgi:glycerol-3-phosphate acyltransferase PlsY